MSKKKIFLFILLLLIISCSIQHFKGVDKNVSDASNESIRLSSTHGISPQTQKIKVLEKKLKGTLLENEAQVFVEVADEYGFDYALLPAIFLYESGGCPPDYASRNGFNCAGWNRGQKFKSFKEAIWTVGTGLATLSYYETWRKDKDNLTALASRYCFVNSAAWEKAIIYFMEKIEK